ncbi:replication initiation protein [Ornithobacterium rhinotracheale]
MSKVINKDLIQSYVITTAKYDFSSYEKRILYRIVEVLQARTSGLKLKFDYSMQEDLFGNTEFTMPISCFLRDEKDSNYKEVKKALRDLRNKDFEYEDDEHWGVYGIIETPKIKKYDSYVKFTVTPLLLGAFLDFSKGYRKYELHTAMKFESVYSMRFYELFSNKDTPIIYSIDELKKMFKIENKYSRIADFQRSVLEVAKKELDEKSPYSFAYECIKSGRKITHIKFKPYAIPKNRDEALETKSLDKKISLGWDFSRETQRIFKEYFGFTDNGIKNNKELLLKATKNPEFRDWCQEINGLVRKFGIGNPAGFFISEIRKKIDK